MAGPIDEQGPPEHLHPGMVALAKAQREVWNRLAKGMRFPWMTIALLVVMLILHLLVGFVMLVEGEANLAGVVVASRPTSVLVPMGAMYAPAVGRGEIWRLISAVFLHGSGTHILLNGVALYGLGRLCESVYGPIRFLWLFLLTGMFGATLSFVGGNTASVGASGSIFGLMGACIVFGWRYKGILPPPIGDLFRKKMLPWVGLNLFIGMVIPFIDNLGHVGGLVSGAVLAAILSNRVISTPNTNQEKKREMAMQVTMGVGSLLLLFGAFVGVVLSWIF